MGRKNYVLQGPRGQVQVLDGWSVAVNQSPHKQRFWHNAWGNQSRKQGTWANWTWDNAGQKWEEQQAWFCNGCGTRHINMGKQACRLCGKERQQASEATGQPSAASGQNATAKQNLPTPGKHAQWAVQSSMAEEQQAIKQHKQNALDPVAMESDGLPPVPGGPLEPAETQQDQDVDMVEGEFAPAEDAKEVTALNTLRDILDAKTLKQIENAIQQKPNKHQPTNK